MENRDLEKIEEIVADCLEAESLEGAVLDACAREPQLASQIRSSINQLRRHAMLADPIPVPERSDPDRIGGFRLIEKLGQGGMGVVYRAEDISLGREVALKVLRPELVHFGGSRDRFRREVEIVARLRHDGIVPIYHAGESESVPFFTMELVDGESLGTILSRLRGRNKSELKGNDLFGSDDQQSSSSTGEDRSRLDRLAWPDACVELVRQVAEALEHAHSQGVLHRDVKPSNILLTQSGRARLLDFGLARAEDGQDLTRSTSELGSLPYLPPERLRNDHAPPDARQDVWSLGVVLLELVTLENPFLGHSREDTRQNILGSPPADAHKSNPQVSRELATVIAKALAPELDKRYASITELKHDLENLLARRPIHAKPAGVALRLFRFAQRHRAATIATVVTLPVVLAIAWYGEHRLRVASDDQRESLSLEREMSERALYVTRLALAGRHLASFGGGSAEAKQELDRCREVDRSWEWHHLRHQISERMELLLGPETKPVCVARSHTSDHIACGGEDRKLRCLDATGAVLWTAELGEKAVSVAFTRADETIAVHAGERRIATFDRETGRPGVSRTMPTTIFQITASGVRDEIYASGRGRIFVLDAESLETLRDWVPVTEVERSDRRLSAGDAGGHNLILDETRGALVTGHWDGRLRIWSVADGRLLRTDKMSAPHVAGLAILTDGRIVCCSFDFLGRMPGGIDVYPPADAQTGTVEEGLQKLRAGLEPSIAKYVPKLTPIHLRPRSPYGACAIPGQPRFVTGSNILELHDVDRRERLRSIRGAKHVRQVTTDRESTILYVASANGLESYSLQGAHFQSNLRGFRRTITSLAFDPSSDWIVGGDTRGRITVCRTERGRLAATIDPTTDTRHSTSRVQTVAWLDADTLLTLQQDGRLRTWTKTLEPIEDVTIGGTTVECVVTTRAIHIGRDDGSLVSLVGSGRLDARERREHRFGEHAVTSLALDAKGARLAVGTKDGTLRILDAESMTSASEWRLPGEVRSVSFSPDGRRLVALAAPLRIELRDVESGDVLRHWTLPSRGGSRVIWSPKGDRFFSTDWTGLFRVYDPQLDETIFQSGPTSFLLTSLAVDRTKGLVAVGGNGGRGAILRGQAW